MFHVKESQQDAFNKKLERSGSVTPSDEEVAFCWDGITVTTRPSRKYRMPFKSKQGAEAAEGGGGKNGAKVLVRNGA